jgi:NUMOD3 motif
MDLILGRHLTKAILNASAPKQPGVYLIMATGGRTEPLVAYVGAAGYSKKQTIRTRLKGHLKGMLNAIRFPEKDHECNRRLVHHVRKHGIETLFWYPLEVFEREINPEELAECETKWIGIFSVIAMANAGRYAHAVTGVKHRPEFGEAVRLRQLGTKHSPEWNQAIGDAHRGRTIPEERILRGEKHPAFGKPSSEKQKQSARDMWSNMTEAEQAEAVRKMHTGHTTEQTHDWALRSNASQTPEQRSARQKKAWQTRVANGNTSPGRLAAIVANKTPEQRSAAAYKAHETKRRKALEAQALLFP